MESSTSAWAPLRHRIFFALFVAQLVSNIGTLMQNVGSAWLMGDLHASTGVVALVQTATFLPVLLIGIPAGALADIADRRRVILGTQAWMMTFALLLAVLSFADKVTPGLLLALTFGLGLGTAVNGPAFQAIQPDLVPKEDVPQALALGALDLQPRPCRRPRPRRSDHRRVRAGVGVRDQRAVVLRRARSGVHLALAHDHRTPAARVAVRCHTRLPALRRTRTDPAWRARQDGAVHRACGRPPGTAAERRAVAARPRLRRLRHPPRRVRHRRGAARPSCAHGSPDASRRTTSWRPRRSWWPLLSSPSGWCG